MSSSPTESSGAAMPEAHVLLRTVEKHGHIAAWEFDLLRASLQLSPGLLRLLNYTGEAPRSVEGLCDLLPPQAAALLLVELREVLAGKPGFALELSLTEAEGKPRWLRAVADAVHEEGKPVRLLGSFQDITETVQTRQELTASELRYRAVVEDQTEVVSRHLPDGTFVFASEVYCRFFGRTQEELIGNHWQPVVHPDDVPLIDAQLAQLSPENPVVLIENRVYDRHGRLRWMEFVNRGFFSADGKLIETQAVGRDITSRRHAEQEKQSLLQQETQRLESLGLLAGGIAHDFNNLMTAVLGYASLARFELPTASSVQGHLSEIEKAARRSADLCRQLLAYAGKGRVSTELVDLNQLVEDSLGLLKLSIINKVVLHLDLASSVPVIEADPTQLRQVLMNLVLNAADAIGERSGLITISTGVVRASAEYLAEFRGSDALVPGDYSFLEVRDTGCGMTQKTISQIFEPFYTTKLNGRGLGLSAVLGIVRGHKAGIKVYSELSHGSSFKLILPLSGDRKLAAAPPLRSQTGRFPKPFLILVVDDEESVRAIIGRCLESFGLRAVLAKDGREGLQLFKQHRQEISLAVLDLTMPHMGGADLRRELHLLAPSLPVILMSGYSPEELKVRFAGKGFAGFLQKPFPPSDLLALLIQSLKTDTAEPTA